MDEMEAGVLLARWKFVKFTEEATSFPQPVPSPGRSCGEGAASLLVLAAAGREAFSEE